MPGNGSGEGEGESASGAGAGSHGGGGAGQEGAHSGRGGNRGEGSGSGYYYRPPTIAQYLDQPYSYGSLPMGGTPNAPYQTVAPGYADLKAKHTAGYVNPATKERSNPSMFNFNGTVYRYEPNEDAYRDTYTGQLITPINNEVGSSGIAGLYGAYEANQYQPQNANVQPNTNPTDNKILNPEWVEQQERIKQQEEMDKNRNLRFPSEERGGAN